MHKHIQRRLCVLAGLAASVLVGCSPTQKVPDQAPAVQTNTPPVSESGGIAAKNWNDKAKVTAPPSAPLGTPPNQVRGVADETPSGPQVLPDVQAILGQFLSHQGISMTAAKPGEIARLTAAWNNKIIFAPDPKHGGELAPGIMGRLYMFGSDEAIPQIVDGELVVGVWDNTPKMEGGQPKLIEMWYIDSETFRKMMKRDFMGNGYTVFLPFGRYNVDLKQINVLVRFNSTGGRSVMASPELLTLDHAATLKQVQDRLGIRSEHDGFLDKAPAKLPLGAALDLPMPKTK